jgi:Flp pilus assembly protein TadD
MDGRLRGWLAGGLLALTLPAVGCKLFHRDAGVPGGPGVNAPAPIQQAAWWNKQSPTKFTPTENPAPVRPTAKKGQPFKAETDIAIADVELEAAFDESRTGADRDRIIDVARQRLQSALAKDPKNRDGLLALAKLYTWANDRDRAVATYQAALQHYPKDKEVAFGLMRTQVRFEDWAGACKACEMALALDPENRTYRKAYGYVLARGGRWDEAFDSMMMVMGESEARTFMAHILLNTGDLAKGQQQLQIALAKDPQNATARQLLDDLTEYQQTGGVK